MAQVRGPRRSALLSRTKKRPTSVGRFFVVGGRSVVFETVRPTEGSYVEQILIATSVFLHRDEVINGRKPDAVANLLEEF